MAFSPPGDQVPGDLMGIPGRGQVTFKDQVTFNEAMLEYSVAFEAPIQSISQGFW